MAMTAASTGRDDDSVSERECHKGVKHLYETGIAKLPKMYVLPEPDRPNFSMAGELLSFKNMNIQLPVIDFSELRGSNRSQVLKSLANACEYYGCFQLVNHGISGDVIGNMMDVSKRFFELCFEEREKYMNSDTYSPVRYGTSLNQSKDSVFCWRDFLKLMCHPLSDMLPHWPTSPSDFRKLVVAYANENKKLFLMLMEAITENLGLMKGDEFDILEELEDGSQLMVLNCYPPCPEPDLTFGMPPHSDYGFLTLLQHDDVTGFQIQFQEKWVTVEPIPNSFVVMVGDHLEICSNGRYNSVLHRAIVNSVKSRISVASLHTVPTKSVVRPSPKLVDESNPRRYIDTDFGSFLKYISSCEPKDKNFLESRKLI